MTVQGFELEGLLARAADEPQYLPYDNRGGIEETHYVLRGHILNGLQSTRRLTGVTFDPSGAMTADQLSAATSALVEQHRILEKHQTPLDLDELLHERAIREEARRRHAVTADVRRAVWARDGGKCVQCGSREALEFDHMIPWADGGADTVGNLQLLCLPCNRRKGRTVG